MVRINLNPDSIPPDEMKKRLHFISMDCTTFVPPSGILPIKCNDKIKFNLKKGEWDRKGNIDGFFVEEDVRQKFFYPYLPLNFIDIGAANGSWSLPALAAGSKVVAFEIDPRYHQSFLDNVFANEGFANRVGLYSFGIYDSIDIGNIFELEEVSFVPLDDFIRNYPFVPQYIKIDVEGLEKRVLRGAIKTIDLFHPKIFVEVHYDKGYTVKDREDRDDEVYSLLKEFDYKVEKGRGDTHFNYFLFT